MFLHPPTREGVTWFPAHRLLGSAPSGGGCDGLQVSPARLLCSGGGTRLPHSEGADEGWP